MIYMSNSTWLTDLQKLHITKKRININEKSYKKFLFLSSKIVRFAHVHVKVRR